MKLRTKKQPSKARLAVPNVWYRQEGRSQWHVTQSQWSKPESIDDDDDEDDDGLTNSPPCSLGSVSYLIPI